MVALLEPPRVLRGLLANHGVYGLRSDASTSGSWGLWRDRPSQGELGLRAGTRLTGNTLFLCKAPSPGATPTTSSAGSHPEPVPHYPKVPSPQRQVPDSWTQPCAPGPTETSHSSGSHIYPPCLPAPRGRLLPTAPPPPPPPGWPWGFPVWPRGARRSGPPPLGNCG